MKVTLVTVGCKLNQFETEALAQQLRQGGFEVVGSMEDADVVVVNTCTVTNRADGKSRQYMKQARRLGKTVVVTGCYASTDGEEIRKRGLADILLSNEEKFTLVSVLQETKTETKKDDFPLVVECERTRAYLKIQDGCNRFCSYCKIPYGRGRSRSLSFDEGMKRFRELVDRGFKEIVLTGVNISDYHWEGKTLADLLEAMLSVEGEFRVRLSSLQPDQFDDRFLSFLWHPRMAPHFHLSLQSGSTTVLERMRRKYTREDVLLLWRRIREVREDTALTADIIVGFPGETEKEFQETVEVIEKIGLCRVHLFSYSPRVGTWAARQPQIDEQTKKERLHFLEEITHRRAMEWVEKTILGRVSHMLVEESSGGKSYGYTEHYLYAEVNGEYGENTFVSFVPSRVWLHQQAVAVKE